MLFQILAIWGCVPEITNDCIDMTNASSTYLGIAGGAIIGAIVSWWVYNRQKKTADMQDSALNRIKELDESHDRILKKLDDFDTRHETLPPSSPAPARRETSCWRSRPGHGGLRGSFTCRSP